MRAEFVGGPLDGEWRDVEGPIREYLAPSPALARPINLFKALESAVFAWTNKGPRVLRPEPQWCHRYRRTWAQRFDYDGMVER